MKTNAPIRFLLPLCLLTLGTLQQSQAQSTILFSESFEDTWPGAWSVADSNPQDGVTHWSPVGSEFGGEGTSTGSKKGYCAGAGWPIGATTPNPAYPNHLTAFMSRPLDLRNYSAATLKYWLKIPSIEANRDTFRVLLNGVEVSKSTTVIGTWTQFTVNLAANVGLENTLRFEFISDGSVNAEGAYLDDIEVTGTTITEATVFGTGDRGGLENRAATARLINVSPTIPATQSFNNQSRNTKRVSIMDAGTIRIDGTGADPTLAFHNALDVFELQIIAETVIITKPLLLPGTHVIIHARNLRFEGTGSINTTPQSLSQAVASGQNGLNGGNITVYAGSYADTTGKGAGNFILAGGNGQAATRGAHGVNGTSVPFRNTSTHTASNLVAGGCGPQTYTPPAGYGITMVTQDTLGANNVVYGAAAWPTSGTNATAPGTPGRGGNGGILTTNLSSITGTATRGSAGLPGTPIASATSSSTTQCVGGAAGQPSKAMHLEYEEYVFFCELIWTKAAENFTTAGASHPVTIVSAGSAGSRTLVGNPYAWIHPDFLRKVLSDAKDDYLQNRIGEAMRTLKDYAGLLDGYRASSAWNTAPFSTSTTRLELGQLYDEMRILIQQLASGLDYFGNPAGWVPMMSYEALTTVYSDEINRSLDIIYLSQWLTGRQATAQEATTALSVARDKLAQEIAQAQSDYTSALAELNSMQAAAADLTGATNQLLADLQAKEAALRLRAEALARPPDWEIGVRVALKVAGTGCKMIPVYQPALGAVGDVATLGSNFDPDKPWETISGGLDIASSTLTQVVADRANEQATKISNANLSPEQLKLVTATTARNQKLTEMATAAGALSNGIKDVSGFMEATKAPADKIEAELEKLKSLDATYSALVDQIKAHMEKRKDFADKLTDTTLKVAKSSDTITRNLLATDAMSSALSNNAQIINPKVTTYLKDMERRAWDRMLQYHYYMAKAYEYRLLKPYTGTLDLQPFFNQITSIANASGTLTESQRTSLRGVFTNVLATTSNAIITEYNANAPTRASEIVYPLKPSELARINQGQAIYLNFADLGRVQSNEENTRIINISTDNIGSGNRGISVANPSSFAASAKVELHLEHSGISKFRFGGGVYQFNHYNQQTRSKISWSEGYFPRSDSLVHTDPLTTDTGASLLRSVSPSLSTAEVNLYSRPSLWADLKVWVSGVDSNGVEFGPNTANPLPSIPLTSLTLRVAYDRNTRTTSTRNLEVQVSKTLTGAPEFDQEVKPTFVMSVADRNGRKNGSGHFFRTFDSTSSTVDITAFDYGSYKFVKWTDYGGTTLATTPTISLPRNVDNRIVAIYEDGTPQVTAFPTVTTLTMGVAPAANQNSFLASNTPTQFEIVGLPAGLRQLGRSNFYVGTPRVTGSFVIGLSAANSYGIGPVSNYTLTVSGTDTFDSAIGMLAPVSGSTSGNVTSNAGQWFTYVAPSTGILVVDTLESGFDTILEAYEGSTRTNVSFIMENDDVAPGSNLTSKILLPVTAGRSYRILLFGFGGATGAYNFNYQLTNGSDYSITTNTLDGILTITDQSGNADELVLTQPAANQINFAASGRTFSLNLNASTTSNSGAISLANINTIIVNAQGGSDVINVGSFTDARNVTINGGIGDDTVNFQGDITFAGNNSLDVNLQDDSATPGVDQVNIQTNAKIIAAGNGKISILCSRNIALWNGSRLETLFGDLTLEANFQSTATSGNFDGINLNNAILKCGFLNVGLLSLKGKGGNEAGGFQMGIFAGGGSKIMAARKAYLHGIGGDTPGIVSRGVSLFGANTEITSDDELEIIGVGGSASSYFSIGISMLAGAVIDAPFLIMSGTGMGAPGSGANQGLEVAGAGTAIVDGEFYQNIKGVAGPGPSVGLNLVDNASISGSFSTSFQLDSLQIDGSATLNSNEVVFITNEATVMDFGSSSSAGVFGLEDSVLDRVVSSSIFFVAPSIRITQGITRSSATNFFFQAEGGIRADASPTDLNLAGGMLFTTVVSPLLCPITSASDFPKLTVSGALNLGPDNDNNGPAGLSLASTTLAGALGQVFTIVENDGSDPIQTRFNKLPQGATLPWPGSALFEAKISYTGGDGNDVTLTLQTVAGFENWAAVKIPAGKDASFTGDADSDGISNAVQYVFGSTAIIIDGTGVITAPDVIPPDVDVYCERSTTLAVDSWTPIASWINGNPPIFASQVSVLDGKIRDISMESKAFYRYRVIKR